MSEQEAVKKKITLSQLIIVFLLLIIGLMGYFGYHYLTQKDPLENLPFIKLGDDNPLPEYLFSIGRAGQVELDNPMGVALKGKRVYIADTSHHRIVVTDRNGKVLGGFGQYGSKDGQLNYPVSVAVGEDVIYVADLHNNRIALFDNQGKFKENWPNKNTPGLKSIRPLAITRHSDGRLFVADGDQKKIIVLSPEGKVVTAYGSAGTDQGQLSYVNGLTLDEANELLFVADSNNRRIQVWGLDGKFKSVIAGNFLTPRGIAYNPKNELLYVVDTLANQVVVVNPQDPESKQTAFRQVGENGALEFPNGIAADDTGRIYVTEKQGNQVSVYRN